MTKLYPKCHPYHFDSDGNTIKNPNSIRGLAYTAEGYILPCCWCDVDGPDQIRQFEFWGLRDETMKLENNETVDEIIQSVEWYEFHKMLVTEGHLAPKICKAKCGEQPEKNRTYFE